MRQLRLTRTLQAHYFVKYTQSTWEQPTEMHQAVDHSLWGVAFSPFSRLPTLLSHCFFLLSLSFSPRFFSLLRPHLRPLSSSLGSISPSSDVQTQTSKTSFFEGTDPARSMQGLSDMAVIWDKERFFLLPLRKYQSDYLKFWHWDHEV